MSSKSPTVIDGLASVRAVRRAGVTREPRLRKSPDTLPGAHPEPAGGTAERDAKPIAAKAGHTTLPQVHPITCYECGYRFKLRGKLTDTYCPKCRKTLTVTHPVIEGTWTEDIKTIGTVEVKPGATVRDASLVAQTLILAGNIEDARVQVSETVILRNGARFKPNAWNIRDLVIDKDSRFSIQPRLTCRNLIVEGALRAKVAPSGRLTVRAGGSFTGEFRGHRLTVEDGGALNAEIHLSPSLAPARKQPLSPSGRPPTQKKAAATPPPAK